jgi:chromosome segregation protein
MKYLEERLQKAQDLLREIGSINMRALEVYEDVKKGYDEVQEKVNTLENEKLQIMKIIEEIDKKKTREFMKSFRAINALFTTNFAQLYTKGVAFLEIENKDDIFSAGVNIAVKLAKGKYFDVTSLSGGEQTLVALSLLFAIQEHKPYHFYIFDEIDAALDKRNSERLAALLSKYMKSGQYIVITHNDAIIMNANVLYGVSMHEGVSKILSLKIKDGHVSVEKPVDEVSGKENTKEFRPEAETVVEDHKDIKGQDS